MFRNKKKEQELLQSDDLSYCRRCGNTCLWIEWKEDYSEVDSIVCTKCGWTCGNAGIKDVIKLKLAEIKERNKRRRFDEK